MKAYRLSVNLKLGLIVFAVLIALASLAYTNYLVDRLREREQASVRIWAGAYQYIGSVNSYNPYQNQFLELDQFLGQLQALGDAGSVQMPDAKQLETFRTAVAWAQTMPTDDQLNFITDEILIPNDFGVPAIITDSTASEPVIWRNVSVSDTSTAEEDKAKLVQRVRDMQDTYPPIPIELDPEGQKFKQYVFYDESGLVKELRIYPYLQLLFVGLFILVGYLGFSYVRRSEQSSLWVGMAREAAHQLGTPISSLMGWHELLRMQDHPSEQETMALDEIENDIERLNRVASRFSDIGSMPKMEVLSVASVIENSTDYMRRRFPQYGKQVMLDVEVPEPLRAPLNAELFQWVIENLLKNALDAIEQGEGHIKVAAHREGRTLIIDVSDNGKGIDRRQWKNVFRPGYSTKKRGWGLGLSLAKRIIEDYHGGSLSLAQSKVGQGTTFRIELPVA
ncbi:MAG TPA: HAMP domain-containing sensor histidine kinase [Rhodothermales bacterium]|nr:HAMP domain-containing sensor histidine kinase [Rhodothermales bacterium]